jgi:N-acetyl-anhydromuramyl-L-alanine amidase AmpD
MRRIENIIIHHYGSSKATMNAIRSRHVGELGWSEVGYHYIIGNGNGEADGVILEGRALSAGACQSRGFNSKAISILLIGDFDLYYPSKLQWSSLLGLVRGLMGQFGVPADNVLGHRETYSAFGKEPERSCPGFKFDMDRLRKELYPEGAELFSDGCRKRFDMSLNIDGVPAPDVDPMVKDNAVYVNVKDLEKLFDVNVEFHPKLRRVEIVSKPEKREGES